jgi:hypothetical protein
MFPNIDKLAKGFLKQAIASLEEDAKHHDRKASDARASAAMMRKLLPELRAGMPFVSPASPPRPSPPVARVG